MGQPFLVPRRLLACNFEWSWDRLDPMLRSLASLHLFLFNKKSPPAEQMDSKGLRIFRFGADSLNKKTYKTMSPESSGDYELEAGRRAIRSLV